MKINLTNYIYVYVCVYMCVCVYTHTHIYTHLWPFQVALVRKNLPANARDIRDAGSISGLGRSLERRKWQPTPGFLPVESHGQRSLVGYSP